MIFIKYYFQVYGIVTHGIMSDPAIERLNNSEIEKLIVTNTIPQKEHLEKVFILIIFIFYFVSKSSNFDIEVLSNFSS
jgi:hypothetical protein